MRNRKYRSNYWRCRNSHRWCSVKKGVLKNFANFTEKYLCSRLFKIKLQAFSCVPMKFPKLLRTLISKNIWKRLLLVVSYKKLFINTLQYSHDKSSWWKSCSWWFIELWKWRVFILINIFCKKVYLANWAIFSLRIIWGIVFDPETFWLRTLFRELRILNCHCWEMSSVLSTS